MRPIPQRAIDFIKEFEGVELEAYLDIAGVPTIGWGHTKGVQLGQTITMAEAEAFLRSDLSKAAEAMARVVKPDILASLTDCQYAALLSFGFNLGVDKKDGIWGVVNNGELDRVPARMLLYNKARVNGRLVKVAGLVRRRQAEAALWEEGQAEEIDLTAYKAETPPIPRDPTPPSKSATIWGAITAAVSSFLIAVGNLLAQIPEFARTALNAINPFADRSEIAQMVANGIGGLAAVASVFVAWSVFSKKRKDRS